MIMKCSECYYFLPDSGNSVSGTCRRYPKNEDTGINWWCGEFRSKKAMETTFTGFIQGGQPLDYSKPEENQG